MNRIVQYTKFNEAEIVEEAIPDPPERGAVVKIFSSGICHSDVHIADGIFGPIVPFPMILGHEISGVVHSLGKDIQDGRDLLYVGDRVVVYPWGGCRECWSCKQNSHHCANRKGKHAHAYGVFQPGGFQMYVSIMSRWSLVKLPESISFDIGCLLPCSGVTAYNAIAQIQSAVDYAIAGKGVANVLFVGAGGLSLWATEIIKAMYQNKVKLLVVDLEEEKLKDAKDNGADLTVCWTKEATPADKSKQLIEAIGSKMDAAVDFVNVTSSVESIMGAMALNSTVALVGIFGGTMPSIPLVSFALSNLRLQGVYCGSQPQLRELIEFVCKHKLNGPPLRRLQLDDVLGVIKQMNEGKPLKGRGIVCMNHSDV